MSPGQFQNASSLAIVVILVFSILEYVAIYYAGKYFGHLMIYLKGNKYSKTSATIISIIYCICEIIVRGIVFEKLDIPADKFFKGFGFFILLIAAHKSYSVMYDKDNSEYIKIYECSECGTEVDFSDVVCRKCGSKLHEDEDKKEVSKPIQDEQISMLCPECGVKVKGKPKAFEVARVCPKCQKEVVFKRA